MFLLDTNVISELRRANRAAPAVLAWAHTTQASQLFISAITVLELERGVLLLERRDPYQGAVLRAWLDGQVMPGCEGRVLAVVAPGFSADCLETREELAIRGRDQFLAAGGEHFAALDCLNDSAPGMAMLEALVRRELAGWVDPAENIAG